MLATNMVRALIKGNPRVATRLVQIPMADVCISVITESELFFGLALKPEAKKLHKVVAEFLQTV
jgi:tRNA(fMet)-specific endonuclease VapC